MTPEEMAALHALCFHAAPRPWSAAEFREMIAAGAIAVTGPEGFALARTAGPEAELLTLAVHPAARRQGIARRLLAGAEAGARQRGATEMFLEVAEPNQPARALYAAAGWIMAGRRPGYYATRPPVAALILRKSLAG